MSITDRASILANLQLMRKQRRPIIGGGAGSGLSAKSQEQGGVDLIVIYNSGKYRMAGRGSLAGLLAYGNANDIVVEMGNEVLPVVKRTPVIAGVNGTDPFVLMPQFLAGLKAQGFAGVQNFPTVGLIDGLFRQNLEETGMSYTQEIEMIALARHLDLLTTPYVFSPNDAEAMVNAGADIIVCHMGLTAGGSIGAGTGLSMEQSIALINECITAARRIREDVIVLCHGGPIATADDAALVLRNCNGCDGFYGASSMERLPTELAIAGNARSFKEITLPRH